MDDTLPRKDGSFPTGIMKWNDTHPFDFSTVLLLAFSNITLSLGSKVRVSADGQTDGQTEPIKIIISLASRSIINNFYFHNRKFQNLFIKWNMSHYHVRCDPECNHCPFTSCSDESTHKCLNIQSHPNEMQHLDQQTAWPQARKVWEGNVPWIWNYPCQQYFFQTGPLTPYFGVKESPEHSFAFPLEGSGYGYYIDIVRIWDTSD